MDVEKWVRRCDLLSRKVVKEKGDERKYLMTNFSGTLQENDINVHTSTMGNDFYRTKDNLKVDSNDEKALALAVKNKFDISDWASRKLNLSLGDCSLSFMPQLKSCNVYCPWCFVDDISKNGKKGNGKFFSIPEIVDAFENEKRRSGKPLHIMRLSGGEPTLAPWQWTELLSELEKRGLEKEVYFQGETNLTTGSFIKYLQRCGRLESDFLERIASYDNFGVLCSFKGTDIKSFLRATGFIKMKKGQAVLDEKGETIPDMRYAFLERERWHGFDNMVKAGIDCYPFIYDPNPETIEFFLQEGVRKYGKEFVSKTWVFPLNVYGPERVRLIRKGIDPVKFQARLDENFRKSDYLMKELVPEYTGHNYKEILRTGIELKIRS